jgi:hypothetical protein
VLSITIASMHRGRRSGRSTLIQVDQFVLGRRALGMFGEGADVGQQFARLRRAELQPMPA